MKALPHAGRPCRYRPIERGDDGCISGIRRCTCGRTFVQTKRRPADVPEDQCTWHETIACRNHPDKGVKK